MKHIGLIFLLVAHFLSGSQTVHAQSNARLVIVLKVDRAVAPAMEEYIKRGIRMAERRSAEAIIIQLNTPGGGIDTMHNIVQSIRGSSVSVIVYVAPRGAMAASAGSIITLAGHASAMAPETVIGAASPTGSKGEDLGETMQKKIKEDLKATVRVLAEHRRPMAIQLAEQFVDQDKAVSSTEALNAGLIDFIATDLNDLLRKLEGFKVHTADGDRTLRTANANVQNVNLTLLEQLLDILNISTVAFSLIAVCALVIIAIPVTIIVLLAKRRKSASPN